MRLIDITEFFESLTDHESVSGILTKLSKQPTIDAVPVVRCRECKSYDHGCCVVKRYRGDDSIITMPPGGYCSYGQRKIETVLPKSDAKDESLEADHD